MLIFAWCERNSLCAQINTSSRRLMSTQDTLKPYCCCLWARVAQQARRVYAKELRIGGPPPWTIAHGVVHLFTYFTLLYVWQSIHGWDNYPGIDWKKRPCTNLMYWDLQSHIFMFKAVYEMEASGSSETPVQIYQTSRIHISTAGNFHFGWRGILRYYYYCCLYSHGARLISLGMLATNCSIVPAPDNR